MECSVTGNEPSAMDGSLPCCRRTRVGLAHGAGTRMPRLRRATACLGSDRRWSAKLLPRWRDIPGAVANEVKLPESVQERIRAMRESSYGANRVALVLRDGTVIEDVDVAWASDVVRIAGSEDFTLDPEHVVDAQNRA